jgi:hypothetical protein
MPFFSDFRKVSRDTESTIDKATTRSCSPLGKARLSHNLNFNNQNTTKLIGRLYVNANQFIGLEILHAKWVETLD